MSNYNEPAFARPENGDYYGSVGLTKLEYFTAEVMKGLLSSGMPEYLHNIDSCSEYAVTRAKNVLDLLANGGEVDHE